MSQISVNNITNLDGTSGPVISGITTVNSDGYMRVPVGDTFRRSVPPGVVTKDLKLYLDSSIDESYPGKSSRTDTWYNISNFDNKATFPNGITYENESLYFNTSNSNYATISNSPTIYNRTLGSICFWIKPLSGGGSGIFQQYQYDLNRFALLYNGSLQLISYSGNGGSSSTPTIGFGSSQDSVRLNEWTNVCFTYNFTTNYFKYYINGQLDSILYDNQIRPAGATGEIMIGCRKDFDVSGYYFSFINAYIDNFSYYDRELTEEEARSNFEALRYRFGV